METTNKTKLEIKKPVHVGLLIKAVFKSLFGWGSVKQNFEVYKVLHEAKKKGYTAEVSWVCQCNAHNTEKRCEECGLLKKDQKCDIRIDLKEKKK